MINLQLVETEVKALLAADNTGHGFEHVERVYRTAMKLAQAEAVDLDVVALAALLHDADDYKLFGAECAENLTNAKAIMHKAGVPADKQQAVCSVIANMGYSKALRGIRPVSAEGKVVSDADMLDAMGALGVMRTLAYALARCETAVFDRNVWPELNLSAEEYKKPNRKSDNFVNHFFEKLLRLKNMMMTAAGKKEAEKRHHFMVGFLRQFFEEQGCTDWVEFLQRYEGENKAA